MTKFSSATNTPNKTGVGTCPGPKRRSTDDNLGRRCAAEQTGLGSEEHQMRGGHGNSRQPLSSAFNISLPQARTT